MKESLKLLNVQSSGIEGIGSVTSLKKSDEEIFNEASNLSSQTEKETYLRKALEKVPVGYVRSKRCLAEIIKKTDPKYACELVMSASQYLPEDPENYLLFSEIAVEHEAWTVAKDSLEVAMWLCAENKSTVLEKIKVLFNMVLKKISSNEKDSSKNGFWYNKSLDKYWVLERLYYLAKANKLVYHAFKLLEVFSKDIKNYQVVFKALTLIDKKEAFYQFIDYVDKHLVGDKLNKNLYLGMSYYELFDFERSIIYLEKAMEVDPMFPRTLLYLALNCLMKKDFKEFCLISEKIIPVAEPLFIAVYFIFAAVAGSKLDKIKFPDQKNISKEISVIVDRLLKNKQLETVISLADKFKKLDYYLILPFLQLYLGEVLIKNDHLGPARQVLESCNDSEVFRLYAWIYRLEGKENLAEEELIKYRKNWIPDKNESIQTHLVNLDLPGQVPDNTDKIFEAIKSAYSQAKELTRKMDLEYGLNAMTCIETGCQDCCTKTFPYISFIEYFYMRKWLDKQPEEFKNQIYEQSLQIVSLYKEKYKKDPPFLLKDTTNFKEKYPSDFVFRCPYLGENKCNVYEARPFTCRSYSYGSSDRLKYMGCNYFFEQLKGATKLNNTRKIINTASFVEFAKLCDEKLVGKSIIAPIPVWFAQSHEQTLEKIKKL